MSGIQRLRRGEEIRIDGFVDDAGAGDGVWDDDLFDLCYVFGWGGVDFLVGTGVWDERCDVDGCAAEGGDDCLGSC